MLPPADGLLEVIERPESDRAFSAIFDQVHKDLADLEGDKMLLWRQRDVIVTGERGASDPWQASNLDRYQAVLSSETATEYCETDAMALS